MDTYVNKIHNMDALDFFNMLPDKSVQTIITSPPYYGLRNYQVDGQLGLEDTPQAYIARLVAIFEASRRVLRDDGTIWVNLGDSYAGSGKGRNADGNAHDGALNGKQGTNKGTIEGILYKTQSDLPPKSLMMIPARFAIAMQDCGWILRNDIIWAKTNPMPESVTDRCTNAHEHIYLFAKRGRYYCDMDAIKEDAVKSGTIETINNGNYLQQLNYKNSMPTGRAKPGKHIYSDYRNKRDVWTVSTKPYSEAHFATFPMDLIEPCVLAGSPVNGVVCDPFMGSGTTALVAIKHGRQWIGCELNPDYVGMAEKRIAEFNPYLPTRVSDTEIQLSLLGLLND